MKNGLLSPNFIVVLVSLGLFTAAVQKGNQQPSASASKVRGLDSTDAETGLALDPNLMLVKAHCTGCHSPKMITQVRLKREEWQERIRWMQRNHKLWDLGEAEKTVLDYLEKHYSPSKSAYSRRESLRNVKWHRLENEVYGSYFKSFDGTKIYYEQMGAGKPIVLLHGFIVNATMWKRSVREQLAAAGYRVIVPDLRGNGYSDKPHDPKMYANNAEIKDIQQLMKHLNIKQFDLMGYSRGAIVAAKIMSVEPGVQKVVLGGMGENFTNPNWDRRQMMYEAFAGKSSKYPQLKGAVAYAKSINADTLVMQYLQKYQPVTTPSELKRINKPVLVISGNEDFDNGSAEKLTALIPKAICKRVPGNHNNTHSSAAFATEVINFLK
ncbi:MAG: alpha/beta fold hydrolase [Runella slithyformis]|nr:MAG: alpha/beta fold hydrolase [Runella slithyformis]TAF48243.1 MAG: alpha/beta fold hydrolase [Runella slithyformis]